MSDQADSLREDITYMRRMAEQGRSGPVLGGAFLTAAGLLYGAAAAAQWLVQTGALVLPVSIVQLWGGASILFAMVWFVLFFRLRRTFTGSPAPSQFAFGMAWTGCGIGIMAMLGALTIASGKLNAPALMEANALVAFAFYGAAWFVSGALARQAWMFVVAMTAFAFTIALAVLIGTADELLAFAIGLVLTLAVPGAVLILRAPR